MLTVTFLMALVLPHKYHASLTEMELNPESGKFEVVLRLFTDDLERALGKRAQQKIVLDTYAQAEPSTFAYVQSVLVMKDGDGKPCTATWVGMEVEIKHTWVYVEIDAPKDLSKAALSVRTFFGLFGNQLNTVNIKAGTQSASMTFQPGERFKPIAWK